ncbi:MAG: acyltransferase [Planctomycetota bacterium]
MTTDTPQLSRPGYRPGQHVTALDGLRGAAVLAVVFYHCLYLPGDNAVVGFFNRLLLTGWVGVDLFFVLSGFLITGILLDTRKSGGGYFVPFYARRLFRIFPLYFLLLAIVFIGLPLVAPGVVPEDAQRSQVWFWLHISNIYYALYYWSWGALSPTWSLAIEEQFYLVWPAVVLLCPPRALKWVCLGLAVMAFGLRVLGRWADFGPVAIYVFTLTRVDGLALGAWVAIMVRDGAMLKRWGGPLITLAAVVGAGMVAFVCFYDRIDNLGRGGQTIGYSAAAIAFAGLILAASGATHANRLQSLCAAGWLRFFGKYSYAIYLFHRPVESFVNRVEARLGWETQGTVPLALLHVGLVLGVTTLVSVVTWYTFESRILKLKRYFPYGAKPRRDAAAAGWESPTLQPSTPGTTR